jgi:pimeloyl-ACP methyl ester carboxylesterase
MRKDWILDMESRALGRGANAAPGGAEYTSADGRRNAPRSGLATVEVEGVEIPWCANAGAGPPVVLLPGLGWRATGSVRSGSGLQALPVVALDYPRRWPRRPLDTVAALAQLYGAALEALGLRGARLLGVSFGGMVALRLAVDRPDLIASLGLVSTAAAGDQVSGRWRLPLSRAAADLLPAETFYGLYRKLGPRLVGTASCPDGEAARLWSDPMGRRKMSDLLRAVSAFDARDRLGEVRCPTLILHGAQDSLITPRAAASLARGISGSRYVVVEGADHFAFITHRRRVLDELERFWR